ncbi:MAG: LytTR family DNA-binding domain-containing protein [Bacteroidota bacterium]
MNGIQALIVDDELDSRETLAAYLQKYCKSVKVVGTATNIVEAQEAIERLHPQLVFLDIEMPYGNAFDLLERLGDIQFETIFITAFSQYAIQALNLSAAHYLLKPIDIDGLILAVDKVKDRLASQQEQNHTSILLQNISSLNHQHQKIVLPLINGFKVRRVKEVIYCEAEDNFTRFHFTDGNKSLICRKLKFYEELLDPLGFYRIHRSTMVNLEYVQQYIKGKGGQVIMNNREELEVAQSRKKGFLDRFGL